MAPRPDPHSRGGFWWSARLPLGVFGYSPTVRGASSRVDNAIRRLRRSFCRGGVVPESDCYPREGGCYPRELLGPHSRKVHQLLMEACVWNRSVPTGDRLQRMDDERGQPERHGAKREQRREGGCGVSFERILHFRERPSAEGDASKLSPTETPSIPRSVLLAPVLLSFASQRSRGDSEEPRAFGEPVRRVLANSSCRSTSACSTMPELWEPLV